MENMKKKSNWEIVLDCLLHEEILDEKYYKVLKEFQLCENAETVLKEEVWDKFDSKMGKIRKHVSYLRKVYSEEKNDNSSINIEPEYAAPYLRRVAMYMVLNQVFEGKYFLLQEAAEKKCVYKRYSKSRNVYDDSHNQSPITDLVIENVTKGAFYKRIPRDLKNKAEYCYDENGNLLSGTWYDEEGKSWWKEFWFYCGAYIWRVAYRCLHEKTVGKIGFQRYEGDYIAESEAVFLHNFEGKVDIVSELKYGKYDYLKENMVEAFEEEFMPKMIKSGMETLRGIHYLFFSDSQGLLETYIPTEYWNGKKVEKTRDGFCGEIKDKKRWDTGRDSFRWKRPSYFDEAI